MTCAACAARVQRKLGEIPDVLASVNLATEKATVSVPPSVSVDLLVATVERAGYGAELARSAVTADFAESGASPEADVVARLRRRLIVALVFFVPLSDLSVQLSLFPAFRFSGWQWVLLALAVPVAGWAAWPFHFAAVRAARHGTTSMDTLVSLGILAACGWSVWAMFALDNRQSRTSALHLLIHASGGGIYLEVAASVTTFLLAGRWYESRRGMPAGWTRTGPSGGSRSPRCGPATGS
jgi:Cu+-exporting ATPase